MEENWRFPGNGNGDENGLKIKNSDSFQKDPLVSLAREICQNSIDAKKNGEEKIVVEFKTAEINKENIPGYDRLKAEIENCKEYRKITPNKDEYKELCKMNEIINKEKITCLRISDFNTTGLVGKKFYLLTKGSGISDKIGSTGGSQGVGKYASFVVSTLNTVFYSTYTEDGECKYMGISRLCSAPISKKEELTTGTGYYGINEKNEPINSQLELTPEYTRKNTGTDIYIIGFNKEENWKKKIISTILESFIVAIYKNELEVKINNTQINKGNLKEIIENNEYILKEKKKSIISQYILIKEDKGVFTKEIDILGEGNVTVYVKSFSKEEAEIATYDCTMIRYPYMKIYDLKGISSIPCSAMCIIGDNSLNEQLKKIENAQHTAWELNRETDIALKRDIKNKKKYLIEGIKEYVLEILAKSTTETLDIEGAGDYLPENDAENDDEIGGEQQTTVVKDNPKIIKKVKNKSFSKNPTKETDDNDGLVPDIGGITEDGNDVLVPTGHNGGTGGGIHVGDQEKGFTEEGDQEVLRKVALTDIEKRFFVVDKEKGEYVATIDSTYEETECELEIKYFDDGGNTYTANILKCIINNTETDIENGKAVKFKIHRGKNKAQVYTNLKEYYRCEVKLYANR